MMRLRRLAYLHPAVSFALILMALTLRLLVPAGFMPVSSHGFLTVELCTGAGPITTRIEIPGTARDHGSADHKAAKEMPCAFSGLSTPSLAAADPALLAAAILFTIAIVQHVAFAPIISSARHLRPPLRGPPSRA